MKKLLESDVVWLPEARGNPVSVILAPLMHLPDAASYRVLFMRRAMPETLASQRRMLVRRGAEPRRGPSRSTWARSSRRWTRS